MIEYRFGPDDLGRVRFAISPLFELASSRQVLRDPARHSIHEPWAKAAAARVADLDLSLLDAVIPEGPYLPDFVTPPPRASARAARGGAPARARDRPARIALEIGWAYPGPACRRRPRGSCSTIPRRAASGSRR